MTALGRLAVLVSGSGSNLQAILDACARGDLPAIVAIVISDRPDAYALERARNAGVPVYVVDRRATSQEAFEREIAARLEDARVDLICLAGFVRILTAAFVDRFRGRILNVHPSLLPRHGGKGMYGDRVHRAVLASGDRESGCTVHLVTAEPDAGPIVLQARVPVHADDTPASLAARIAVEEHRIYPAAIGVALRRLRHNATEAGDSRR